MTAYQKFQKLPIDFSAIGFAQGDNAPYYCTPKDAEIIGWAGVDGIHYCTIPEFGEMIFAVSPMNLGDCVHPIARNFEDLLRLLLYCGDMAALEQCYAWDEEQFKAFLLDCPATEEQQAVLDAIGKAFRLKPMEDAFSYVKQLQSEFDLSRIPYTEDYYDPDMNAAAPVRPAEWKVTYDGGFWGNEEDAGDAVDIGKTFSWGEEIWHIPAAYVCGKGLVIDFCVEVAPEKVKAFMDKWDLMNEERHQEFGEAQRQMERENPLNVGFRPTVQVNGQRMREKRSSSVYWIAASCVRGAYRNVTEARAVLEHYDLDASRCWSICRASFPWAADPKPEIKSMELHLERRKTDIPGICFKTPSVGESVVFTHPVTGVAHTLTVKEYTAQEMEIPRLPDEAMEYPSQYHMMVYTLQPEISEQNYSIQDCDPSEEPRCKPGKINYMGAACIGIIGGADGPTAIVFSHKNLPKPHAACSSLRFAPAQEVRWRMVFHEKQLSDMNVQLI